MTRSLGLNAGLVAIFAVAALMIAVTPALATHVQCGDVITQDTTLDSDVVCTNPGDTGLSIGADDITLWLNGHAIRGAGSGTGIVTDVGDFARSYAGVHVTDGTIEGFGTGISAKVADGSIRNMVVTASESGIFLRGAGNVLHRNVVELTGDQSDGDGIVVIGAGAFLSSNAVRGDALFALMTQGDNPRVMLNTVENCVRATGIFIFIYETSALVARNKLMGCDTGISAWGTNARVQRNVASGGCRGMFVLDAAAVVQGNKTSRNCHTGIESNEAGTTLKDNVANRNGDYGINAAPGTIDGGGNRAQGNGIANCVNVSCK